ncbi:MAG: sugar phosphate isomerase/epimerase [bacterium]|nr:sugar phosphate isomerase/epimerase [bacterium]
MNVGNIALNIYSFGYSAGFIKDDRNLDRVPSVRIKEFPALAKLFGLGGIEFPFDYYFSNRLQDGIAFVQSAQKQGLRVAIDFEKIDEASLMRVISALRTCGIDRARIKMNHALYGGNRYKIVEFDQWKEEFINQLQRLVPLLAKAQFKFLIENHQDFGSVDLVDIITRTSKEWIGINWDIGNSFAVGETPEMFLARAKSYIVNLHLKDYYIVKSKIGFGLMRCPLGQGAVDLKTILSALKGLTMSIEIGAQHTRYVDGELAEWWESYPTEICASKEKFLQFIYSHLGSDNTDGTLWEQYKMPHEIEEREMQEIRESVDFLKGLVI